MNPTKCDILMWTHNANVTGRFIDVLDKADKVLKDVARRKIAVDANSTDATKILLESHGWEIHQQRGKGIGDAVRQAFTLPKTHYFITLESDVILADNWLEVFDYMTPETISVSGIRLANIPELREIEKFTYANSDYVSSIDNNLWDMSLVTSVGDFPTETFSSDSIYKVRAIKCGFKWKIISSISSIHIRTNIDHELKHKFREGRELCMLNPNPFSFTTRNFIRVLTSPARGFQITLNAYRNGTDASLLSLFSLYPKARWIIFRGAVQGLMDLRK